MIRWVQNIYDSIKGLRAPLWLRIIIQELNDLMIQIIREAGQAYINYLKEKILEAAQTNWTAREKFEFVFKEAKKGFSKYAIELKDNELNTIINYLYSRMKKDNIV